MKALHFLTRAVAVATLAVSFLGQAKADILWESNFEVTGGTSGQQYDTSNTVWAFSDITGWDKAGVNAAHALLRDGTDWALMVYSGFEVYNSNTYTQGTGFAANEYGVTYWVAFDIGATVWAAPDQATTATDSLRFTVLGDDNSVIASQTFSPGAWSGTQTFHQKYYSYVGTGSGLVRLQITSGNPGSNTFAGAINNISIWNSQPIPEPSTAVLLGLAAIGGCLIRRKRA